MFLEKYSLNFRFPIGTKIIENPGLLLRSPIKTSSFKIIFLKVKVYFSDCPIKKPYNIQVYWSFSP